MGKSVIKTTSNMRKVIREVHDGLEDMVDEWKDDGETYAKATLSRREAQRGYSLDTLYDNIHGEKVGDLNAAVISDWPTGEPVPMFFEYGTVYIAPMPYIRPAKAKADKNFRDKAKRQLQTRADRARLL